MMIPDEPFQAETEKERKTAGGLLQNYVTETELARELSVCRETIIRWRRLGAAPAITVIGRKIFFHKDAIKAWLESCEIDEGYHG